MAQGETTEYENKSSFTNWSKTHKCFPSHRATPKNEPELQAALAFCSQNGLRATVAGAMLSPSDISMSSALLIDMRGFNKILAVDTERRTVRVQAGVVLKTLIEILRENYRLAFPSIGSITDQTVGGLLATAVHGTGRAHGSFCSIVTALRLMKADGEVLDLQPAADESPAKAAQAPGLFYAALVSLGCLGVVVDVTLSLEKAFSVRTVQRPVHLDELYDALSSFSLRYEYFRAWLVPYTDRAVVWYGERIEKGRAVEHYEESSVFSKLKILSSSCPYPLSSALSFLSDYALNCPLPKTIDSVFKCLFQSALLFSKFVPSALPAVNRLFFESALNRTTVKSGASDKMFTIDCLFDQRVSEWAVEAHKAEKALRELVLSIEKNRFAAHPPIEVRFTARDEAWLSPSHGGVTCYIGIIVYRPFGMDIGHKAYFANFEEIMKGNGGRPHWAKEFGVNKDYFSKVYGKWDDWCRVKKEVDPNGVFGNEWSDRVFGH